MLIDQTLTFAIDVNDEIRQQGCKNFTIAKNFASDSTFTNQTFQCPQVLGDQITQTFNLTLLDIATYNFTLTIQGESSSSTIPLNNVTSTELVIEDPDEYFNFTINEGNIVINSSLPDSGVTYSLT